MNVGVNPAAELKKRSMELAIPFPDLLRGFVVEDLLDRIAKSSYREHMMLADCKAVGIENYRRQTEERLSFYYKESEKQIAPEKLIPGQTLTGALLDALCRELFEDRREVEWEYAYQMRQGYANLELTANYFEMMVPLSMRIVSVKGNVYRVEQTGFQMLMDDKPVSLYLFAPGNQLSKYFFEIMKKLELISDMAAYDSVNEILKAETVSGRHVMEELSGLCEREPKILRLKRMEQIEGYVHYKYMENRWEKYKKAHHKTDSWQEVLERFVTFAKPIWTALCRDEIFFDDWMPELGRYLG